MSKKISMRDSFFDGVYNLARADRDVVLVDADMGAPSLDKFRRDLPNQFVNVGIAEHNMIAVATGLGLEGKKVFTFAIAPFTTSRCYEFIKIDSCLMNVPINIISCGTGFGYDDSGPTHHTTEDISIMRALPNLEILCPSDSKMAGAFANLAYESKNPTYVRLDRQIFSDIYGEQHSIDSFEEGFKELEEGNEIAIVSTGNMVHRALEVNKEFSEKGKNIGVVDLYRLKPINQNFVEGVLGKYKQIVSLEEHLLAGGMGSILAEFIMDNDLSIKLKRVGVDDGYYYLYGRENIHKKLGLDLKSLVNKIEKLY